MANMSIEDVWAYPPPPERKYRKAADSKAQLIAAGRELLAERGLAPGLSRVTLNDAIERSGIPRSSAYRLYSGGPGPLESFRLALLEAISNDHMNRENTWGPINEVIDEHKEGLESGDPKRLATALRQIIRVGVQENLNGWIESTGWYVVASSMVAASSPGAEAEADIELLRTGENHLVDSIMPIYEATAKMVGLRPRAGTSWEQFARIVSGCLDGLALRNAVDPSLNEILRPTGPNGEMQTWTAAAVVFEALLVSYAEPDPGAPASADLTGWTLV